MANISKINGYNLKDAEARTTLTSISSDLLGHKILIDGNTEKINNFKTGDTSVGKAKDYDKTTGTIKDRFDSIGQEIGMQGEKIAEVQNAVVSAQDTADQAKLIAEGRAKAVSFDTLSAMTTALKSAAKSAYKVGDNLFIKATDVPDYWVSGVLDTNTGTYGYFSISPLETQKVDLTEYAKTADITTSGTIKAKYAATADYAKGYIDYQNAPSDITLGEKIKTIDIELSGNRSEITKIKDGTTTVPQAGYAINSGSAGNASNYNTYAGTIKDKFDELDAKTVKFTYNAGTEELTISFS